MSQTSTSTLTTAASSSSSTVVGGNMSGKSVDTLLDSDITRVCDPSTSSCAAAPITSRSHPSKPTPGSSAAPASSSCPRSSISNSVDKAIANLTPAWFTSTMGTGIVSILLYNFPYPADWLRYLGIAVFCLNVLLFTLLAGGNVVRFVRYKGVFGRTLDHQVAGMFWGALPMGLATIVNMVAYVCVPRWGGHWVQLAVGLWWIDAILSVVINLGMLIAMFTRQTHTPESMSATWLLPIVSSVVAAASGGVVASSIAPFSPSLAHSTVVVSFIIWGTGVPIACFIMALYIYRTAVYGVPAAGAIPSVLLPIGPCGQGSFGIVLLGRTVRDLVWVHATPFTSGLAVESTRVVADAIYAGCLITGLILWGLGLCWYIVGFYVFLRHALVVDKTYMAPDKFTLGLYALTFPIGVFATGASIIAAELDSTGMRVIAAFLAVQVVLSWMYVAVCNVRAAYRGTVWNAPELAGCGVQKRWVRQGSSEGGDLEKQ